MSSLRHPQVPSTPNLAPTAPKRIRKSRKRTGDDDAQRERKREMDRKAQRLSREKTKSHIAHLEKLVEMLYEKNDSAANIELLEEVGRLNTEIERLRKIIWNIQNLVGGELLGLDGTLGEKRIISRHEKEDHEASTQASGSISGQEAPIEMGMDMDGLLDANHFEESPSSSIGFSVSTAITDRMIHDQDLNAMAFENYDELIIPSYSAPLEDEFCSNYAPVPTPHSTAQLWTFLNNPLHTIIRPPEAQRSATCHLWRRANQIYSTIFTISRSQLSEVTNFDTGLLFQAIRDGWGSLTATERRNPILQILREIDQQLFRHLDSTSRLAIVYKSQALVRYFVNAGPHTFEQLPSWQRPLPSQKPPPQLCATSFFPWPLLRARLLSPTGQSTYFSTPEFSLAYARHFKLFFPFAFADTFSYDPITSKYEVSPLFERYHRDLRYWGMQETFFELFPELRESIAGLDAGLGVSSGNGVGPEILENLPCA